MVHRFLLVGALAVGALLLGACAEDGASPATTLETQSAASPDIVVTGTNSLRFEPDTFILPAGEQVTLVFSADSGVEHDFCRRESCRRRHSRG